MSLEYTLDTIHARARRSVVLQRLALVSRILLAVAFVPTSIVKLQGHRFTSMGIDNPIGFFFEAMYRSGGYWRFIGAAQLVAATLLLIPRTTTLGALIFLPVVLNIFVITVALGFTGTPFITGPMLLACVFLLCWDYDRFKPLFFPPPRAGAFVPFNRLELAGFGVGLVAAMVVMSATRGLLPMRIVPPTLGVGLVGGLLVLAGWFRLARARR